MHGIIHSGLRRYVVERYGEQGWRAVLAEAGVEEQFYLVVGTYSDDELVALVNAASRITGATVDEIHEDYGQFITPDLMRLNHALIRPHWKTFDLLINTEDTIHRHVRRQIDGAAPPALNFEQTGENRLRLHYGSPRRMSGVARGIIRGIAAHYGETVTIDEQRNEDGSSVIDILIE